MEHQPETRRRGRTKSRFAVALLAGVLLIPTAVYAAGGAFTDDDTSVFENDINWMADNGITTGCTPSTYCPDDNVTRGQMAAFMHRLATKKVVDAGTVQGSSAADLKTKVNAASADYYVGPAPASFTGFVKLLDLDVTADVDGIALLSGMASFYFNGLPSRYGTWAQLDKSTCTDYEDNLPGARGWGNVGSDPAGLTYDTVSFTTAVALTAGAHTITLCAESLDGDAINPIDSSLTSAFSVGGAVLAPQSTARAGGGAAPGN
jgi:hypothetical protein